MSFVVSQPDLDKYYALGVRKFVGARMMGVMYHTRPEIAQRLLPPPLEPAAAPGALIFIAEYPETNLGPGYREAALFLQCQYKGEAGTYCLSMPIDSQSRACTTGATSSGSPRSWRDRFLAPGRHRLRLGRSATASCSASWRSSCRGRCRRCRRRRRPSCSRRCRASISSRASTGRCCSAASRPTVEPRSIEIGTPRLTLHPSPRDPWHEVEAAQVMMGFYLESDNTMQPGRGDRRGRWRRRSCRTTSR